MAVDVCDAKGTRPEEQLVVPGQRIHHLPWHYHLHICKCYVHERWKEQSLSCTTGKCLNKESTLWMYNRPWATFNKVHMQRGSLWIFLVVNYYKLKTEVCKWRTHSCVLTSKWAYISCSQSHLLCISNKDWHYQ